MSMGLMLGVRAAPSVTSYDVSTRTSRATASPVIVTVRLAETPVPKSAVSIFVGTASVDQLLASSQLTPSPLPVHEQTCAPVSSSTTRISADEGLPTTYFSPAAMAMAKVRSPSSASLSTSVKSTVFSVSPMSNATVAGSAEKSVASPV